MSERIYQQINLYQPIFRRQRHIFSALTMLQAAAVVVVALMTIYGFGLWQVSRLEAEALQLEGREQAYAAQLARLDTGAGVRQREDIERELAALRQALDAQQRLLRVLYERPLGTTAGFSDKLAALGRRSETRLWLTEIRINGATNAVELVGRSSDPDHVPVYLQRLGAEPALSGQRFDDFEIARNEDDDEVSFRVSSRAVDR